MTSADVAIRYSYNKKMKKFKVSCKSKYMKKVYFALPKSFGDCKGYMQFAMVDDYCNYGFLQESRMGDCRTVTFMDLEQNRGE